MFDSCGWADGKNLVQASASKLKTLTEPMVQSHKREFWDLKCHFWRSIAKMVACYVCWKKIGAEIHRALFSFGVFHLPFEKFSEKLILGNCTKDVVC